MKKIVIGMLVGLIGFTSAVLPSYAVEQTDSTSGATTEATDQSTSQTQRGKGKHAAKEEVAEPENAIGKAAAKEKALADAGLTSEQTGKVRSRVSTLEDGTVIYKVKFTYDNQKYTYQINAISGEVLDKSAEACLLYTSPSPRDRG